MTTSLYFLPLLPTPSTRESKIGFPTQPHNMPHFYSAYIVSPCHILPPQTSKNFFTESFPKPVPAWELLTSPRTKFLLPTEESLVCSPLGGHCWCTKLRPSWSMKVVMTITENNSLLWGRAKKWQGPARPAATIHIWGHNEMAASLPSTGTSPWNRRN